jgi:dUTPase
MIQKNIGCKFNYVLLKDLNIVLSPHYGTVDAGYTGPLGVKVYNVGKQYVSIEKGERYAQIAVIPKPDYEIVEVDEEQFESIKANQGRGDSGFGSSGK